jgi:hypothetical protein
LQGNRRRPATGFDAGRKPMASKEIRSHRLRLLVMVVKGHKCANYIKLVASELRAPDRGYLSQVNASATRHWRRAKGNIE